MAISKEINKIAVLGAGSFGTAIANHISLVKNNHKVSVILYARDDSISDEINTSQNNSKYTKEFNLSKKLIATSDLGYAIEGADLIIFAVPTQSISGILETIRPRIKTDAVALNLAKGLEIPSLRRISQILKPVFGKKQAVLSGPSFSRDILVGNPVGLTLGSFDKSIGKTLRELFLTDSLDVKISRDLIGVEVGGALKNVYGLIAGLIDGNNLGDSLRGDFISRSMVEMRDIGLYLGGKWSTFSGRSGLGDLIVTCTETSRNYRYGFAWSSAWLNSTGNKSERINMAKNAALESTKSSTIEALGTLKAIYSIVDKANMHTPILQAAWGILVDESEEVSQLIPEIRRIDNLRTNEGIGPWRILIHSIIPRLWFRRKIKNKKK